MLRKRRAGLLVVMVTGALSLVVVKMNLDLLNPAQMKQQGCACAEIHEENGKVIQQQTILRTTVSKTVTAAVDGSIGPRKTPPERSNSTSNVISAEKQRSKPGRSEPSLEENHKQQSDIKLFNITQDMLWITRRYHSTEEVLTFKDNSSFPSVRSSPYFSSSSVVPVALSEADYTSYMEMFGIIIRLFIRHNIEFIMVDGTLLGSYLMHDMLPWDDDIDIMVNLIHYKQLKLLYMKEEIFQTKFSVTGYHDISDEYTSETLNVTFTEKTFIHNGKKKQRYHKHKIFIPSNHTIKRKGNTTLPWQWPFVDVKFFQIKQNKVKKVDLAYNVKNHAYNTVYPIVWRPFGSQWAPAPHNSGEFLRKKYKKFRCQTQPYNHVIERRVAKKKKMGVWCGGLWNNYAHVEMEYTDTNTTIEHLAVGNRLVHSAVVQTQVQDKTCRPWSF